MKRYPCKYCLNMRDLGGYPVDGGCVAWGKFIRSDAPLNLTESEVNRLLQMGITTILDLRYPDEMKRKPCFLAHKEGFSYFNYSIGGGWIPSSEAEIPASYISFVEQRDVMKELFQTMANCENGVLFHCSAGKDRTGVVAALLLSLAGTQDCDILADYEVTYTYIRPILQKLRHDDPSLPMFAGHSKIEYMENFLSLFRKKYTDTHSYLLDIGLDGDTIARLKSKLFQNTLQQS